MTKLVLFSENIWFTELALQQYDLDVRGAVICGSQKVAIWDTLTHPRDMQPVLDLVQDRPVLAVYSHADWDHFWGTNGVYCIEVIAQEHSHERFITDVPETLEKMKAETPGAWDAVTLTHPTITFQKKMTLYLGGLSLELHALPGHTGDSMVGFIPEAGILLGGDAVEDPFPLLNEERPLETWMEGLEQWLLDERVRVVVPAHGAVGDRRLLERNLAYLRGLQAGTAGLPPGVSEFYIQSHRRNVETAQRIEADLRR